MKISNTYLTLEPYNVPYMTMAVKIMKDDCFSSKILIVEDDYLFAQTLEDFLKEDGFLVICADNGEIALEKCYQKQFDIYLFDINLPLIDGLSLLKMLRDAGDNTPTIFITSSRDRETLRDCYSAGADDYIRKPLDLEELSLKINAILKRKKVNLPTKVVINEYYIYYPSQKRLYAKNGDDLNLTPKVLQLLDLFLENEGKLIYKELIMNTLWAPSKEPSEGSLRVYISKLQKLFPNCIENIKGVGYRFERVASQEN